MPAVRAPALVLVLVLPALAGCLAGGDADADAPGALTNSSAPSGATLPPGRAPEPAPGVTPATQWVQNGWGDRAEVPLLSTRAVVSNWLTGSTFGCALSCTSAFMQPPEGSFVLPGASEVVVTARWSAPATAPTMRLDLTWRSASDAPPQREALLPGEPLVIPVAAEDWDAPLSARSLWWFEIFPRSDRVDAVFPEIEVELEIVVRRPADVALPEYPEAPDPWSGGTSLPLFAGATLQQTVVRGPFISACISAMVIRCDGFWFEPPAGALVPPGATRMEATVSWSWAGPAKPVLHYYTGAEDEPVRLEPVADGDSSRTYELPVPADAVDSPYQSRSMWWFVHSFDAAGQDWAAHANEEITLDVVVLRN